MALRQYIGPLTDNRRWAKFNSRPNDVHVCTPPKCGTTWTQTIVALLASGDPDVEPGISTKSPWLDIRYRDIDEMVAGLDAQTDQRCIKSHTPFDGLPIFDHSEYLAVYRHPLDVHFSMRRHIANMKIDYFEWYYPEDDRLTFQRFLSGADEGMDYDANSLASIIRHYKSYLDISKRDNVHGFHYADMCRDLPATMARISEIMGVSHDVGVFAALVEAATFDNMSSNGQKYAPSGGGGFWKSDDAFFDSATTGKWQGRLTDQELADYDAAMNAALTADERRWLEHGSV